MSSLDPQDLLRYYCHTPASHQIAPPWNKNTTGFQDAVTLHDAHFYGVPEVYDSSNFPHANSFQDAATFNASLSTLSKIDAMQFIFNASSQKVIVSPLSAIAETVAALRESKQSAPSAAGYLESLVREWYEIIVAAAFDHPSCPLWIQDDRARRNDHPCENVGMADGMCRVVDWLYHAISALLEGRRGQSRILIIAGPPSCGKSFLIREIIRLLLGGRAADAAPWLLGTTDFASELGGAELLYLDDALGDGRLATRLGVAAKQKQIVTAGSKPQPMHAKGKDRYCHPIWWRHAGALNDTPEALSMLPPIDDGYGDKLILLRASDTVLSAGGDSATTHIDVILAELPGFMAHILKHGCQGPFDGRGPLSWHDPQLVWKLREAAPEYPLAGMILEAIEGGDTYGGFKKPLIEPTMRDLARALRNACGDRYTKLCPTDRVTRKYLGRLAADRAVSSRALKGLTRWNLEKLSTWVESQNSGSREE